MQTSAVSQTPVELWTKIFKRVLFTPYHYQETDSIVDDFLLFDSNCEVHRTLRASEEMRTQLRLVCREWNAIAAHLGGYCRTDLGEKFFPSAQAYASASRIEITYKMECVCSGTTCAATVAWQKDDDPSQLIPGPETTQVPYSQHDAVVISLENCPDSAFKLSKELLNSSRLRALAFDMGYLDFDHIHDYFQMAVFGQITRLKLSGVSSHTLENLEGSVVFPQVETLALYFWHRQGEYDLEGKPAAARISTWKVPKIRRLRLSGRCEKLMGKELRVFLDRHGANIRQFVVDLEVQDGEYERIYPWPLVDDIKTTFPKLYLLGTVLENLVSTPGQAPINLATILLVDFPEKFFKKPTTEAHFAHLFSWEAPDLAIEMSWSDVKRKILSWVEKAEYKNRFWIRSIINQTTGVMDKAHERGVTFYDGRGVSAAENDGQDLLFWLKNLTLSR